MTNFYITAHAATKVLTYKVGTKPSNEFDQTPRVAIGWVKGLACKIPKKQVT